jgi:hypothetical protein
MQGGRSIECGKPSRPFVSFWPPAFRAYRNSTKMSFRASPASVPLIRYVVGRDPESRKIAGTQIILDPGSHPATRDLAGMTNYKTVFIGRSTGWRRER